jgi:hypothetical protein
MKRYIENLRTSSDEANLRHQEASAKLHRADTPVQCAKPLTQQIEELMLSLPPALRDRPWSMDELVARTHGRNARRPHAMHIGQALRALGWTQKRDWTRGGAGRRYWQYKQADS